VAEVAAGAAIWAVGGIVAGLGGLLLLAGGKGQPTGGGCNGGCQSPLVCNPATNTCVPKGSCPGVQICNPGTVWDWTQCTCVPATAQTWAFQDISFGVGTQNVFPLVPGTAFQPTVSFFYTGPGGSVVVGYVATNIATGCAVRFEVTLQLPARGTPLTQPFVATLDTVWPSTCPGCSGSPVVNLDVQPYVITPDGTEFDGASCAGCLTCGTTTPATWSFSNVGISFSGPVTGLTPGAQFTAHFAFSYTGPGGYVDLEFFANEFGGTGCSLVFPATFGAWKVFLDATGASPMPVQVDELAIWTSDCPDCFGVTPFDATPAILDPTGTETDGPLCAACLVC